MKEVITEITPSFFFLIHWKGWIKIILFYFFDDFPNNIDPILPTLIIIIISYYESYYGRDANAKYDDCVMNYYISKSFPCIVYALALWPSGHFKKGLGDIWFQQKFNQFWGHMMNECSLFFYMAIDWFGMDRRIYTTTILYL